jgi:TP901 family phage tail tape measure protein
MDPQIEKLVTALMRLGTQIPAIKNEILSLTDAFANMKTAGKTISDMGNEIEEARRIADKYYREGTKKQGDYATSIMKTTSAMQAQMRALNSGPTGTQQPVGGAPKNAMFPSSMYTFGTVTPSSPGINHSPDALARAAKAAAEEIRQQYSLTDEEFKDFIVTIDQATGRLLVQKDVVQDLGGGMSQTYRATATADPFTVRITQYSAAQQAFMDQAGGMERAESMLARHGLTINNVTGYYKELGQNVATFSVTASDGISKAMGSIDQFGNATLEASRNAQTFMQNIGRNISKVIEWSVATGLVYAAMNQVMTAAGEMREIEETMADIAIATGASADELQRYYDAALEVANITGVDVTETLEAQAKAYRAAGDSADQFRTANTLLRDSMILARLGGMDQTKALDTLVAALRQSGHSLEEGTALLDKWVKTTQNAGVSIEDLAESFAITADVASTVGVDVDQLNGLISVLAEKTTLSSTEIGNAVRTMFSNITADEAVSTLQEFGIAVRNVEGEMRGWMDINQDIVDLMNSGVLNDEQINKLANALGGGSRRGPQLIALWQNFNRANEIAAESMSADGEAAAAMEIKLENLQAAINELNNAFNELAQALGFQGGFLEMMTKGIEVATEFVRAVTGIAKSFEDGASSIALFSVAYMGLARVMGNVNPNSPFLQNLQFGGNRGMANAGMNFGGVSGTGVANYLGQQPTSWHQRGVQGMAGPAMAIVGGEIARGIANNESIDRVGARVGATLAGAFVGNMILPGAGGVVGAFMADTFVNQIQSKEDAIRALTTGEAQTTAQINEAINAAFGSQMFDPFKVVQSEDRRNYTDYELGEILAKAIQSGAFGAVSTNQARLDRAYGGGEAQLDEFTSRGLSEEEARLAQQMTHLLTTDNAEIFIEAWGKLQAQMKNDADRMEEATRMGSVSTEQIQFFLSNQKYGKELGSSADAQRLDAANQASLTGSEEYLKQVAALSQIQTLTAAVSAAQDKLNLSTKEYLDLSDILLNATEEERERIVALTSEINELQDQLAARPSGRGGVDQTAIEMSSEMRDLQNQLNELLRISEEYADIRDARDSYRSYTEGPTDSEGNRMTRSESGFSKALQEARAAQDEYAEYLGIDPDDLAKSVTDPLIIAFEDGYTTVEGLTSDFSQFFMDRMKENAEAVKEMMGFAFRDLKDVSSSVIDSPMFRERLAYYENLMKEFQPFGYEEDNQNVGLRLENNQTRVLNTNMTALNMVLEELVEVEKKQLEGVWNLPGGATAFVPITSLFYQQQQGGKGEMGGGTDPYNTGIVIDEAASVMLQAAQLQFDAAQAVRNNDSARWEALGEKHRRDMEASRNHDSERLNRYGEYYQRQDNSDDNVGGGGHRKTSSVNVNIQPQHIRINLNGRQIAEATAQHQSRQLNTRLRSNGKRSAVVA